MAAYLVGAAVADPQGWLAVAPVQLWLVIEAGLSRALYLLVRHGARSADAAIARAERVRRELAVAEARRADEREYLAALHDTPPRRRCSWSGPASPTGAGFGCPSRRRTTWR
jgi:hypothetical protein